MTNEIPTVFRPLPELPTDFSVEKVYIAGNLGACGGVEMTLAAVSQVMEIVPPKIPVWTTNTPINFPLAFERYGDRLKTAKIGDISEVPDGSVLIISAHGAAPKIFTEAEERNMIVIDITCPLVLREQEKVREAAADNVHTVFLGEEGHPETIGIKGQVAPERITIIDPSKTIIEVDVPKGTRVFAKTTNNPEQTDARIKELQTLADVDASRAHSCYALISRFASSKDLVEKVDYLLLVGDETSHNAKGLRSLADKKEHSIPSAIVGKPEQINWAAFDRSIKRIGISGAASAPFEYIDEIANAFRQLGIPVIKLPQVIPEAFRMFRLPQKQIEQLQKRFYN